jgi:hypothetical protein
MTAYDILKNAGFNPNRAPMRVRKLDEVLKSHSACKVRVNICHMRAGGRERQKLEKAGMIYLGCTNHAHNPVKGKFGYQEQIYAVDFDQIICCMS